MANDPSLDPEGGKSVRVAETRAGKFQARATVGDISFLVDEAVAVGGLGTGPDPYDLLSAALGACTAMTVRLYADHKQWPLRHVQVRVIHHRASLKDKDSFERIIEIDGDLDETQRARLIEIAEHCPVHHTLNRGSNIETRMGPLTMAVPTAGPVEHMAAMEQACRSVG